MSTTHINRDRSATPTRDPTAHEQENQSHMAPLLLESSSDRTNETRHDQEMQGSETAYSSARLSSRPPSTTPFLSLAGTFDDQSPDLVGANCHFIPPNTHIPAPRAFARQVRVDCSPLAEASSGFDWTRSLQGLQAGQHVSDSVRGSLSLSHRNSVGRFPSHISRWPYLDQDHVPEDLWSGHFQDMSEYLPSSGYPTNVNNIGDYSSTLEMANDNPGHITTWEHNAFVPDAY